MSRREFLFAAAGLVLTACGQEVGGGAPAPAAGGKAASRFVAVAQGVDLTGWNPYAHAATTSYTIWNNVYDTLVGYDWGKRQFVGRLAESWDISPSDPLTWTFHLRKDVTFQDGSPFTAEDVVYSYNRILHDPQSKQGAHLRQVAELKAADRYTFVLKTKIPYSPLLGQLGDRQISSAAMAQKYTSTDERDRHPLGTGAYKFVSWAPGQQFVVARNDSYWGGKPDIEGGAFKPIPEDQARLTALQTGSIQLMENVPPQDVSVVNGTKGLHVAGIKSGRVMLVVLRPDAPPLSSKAVRQAINYAVDIDAIIKSVLGGRAYRMNQPLSSQYTGYVSGLKGYDHDPEKAKSLLQQAGYGSGFDLVLHSPDGRYIKDKDVAQAIAGQLQAVGIRCSVQTAEWGTYESNQTSGRYPMYLIGRGGILDPDDYLSQYFETGNSKYTGYSNGRVDQLFKQQRATFDVGQRERILQDISQLITDDAPLIPLFNYEDEYGLTDAVQWTPSPDEYVLLRTMKWVGK